MVAGVRLLLSGEKCAQKNVTAVTRHKRRQNAFVKLASYVDVSATTSAPSAASAFALSLFTSRVIARAVIFTALVRHDARTSRRLRGRSLPSLQLLS